MHGPKSFLRAVFFLCASKPFNVTNHFFIEKKRLDKLKIMNIELNVS